MASKFIFFALLITFAFTHGREIRNMRTNEIISTEQESRIIDIPLMGGIFLLVCQVVSTVVSKIWSLVEYKLGALSLVSSLMSWLKKKHILLILAIVGILAVGVFYLVTKVFSANPVYKVDHLVRTVRSLDNGIVKYIID